MTQQKPTDDLSQPIYGLETVPIRTSNNSTGTSNNSIILGVLPNRQTDAEAVEAIKTAKLDVGAWLSTRIKDVDADTANLFEGGINVFVESLRAQGFEIVMVK